jgi:hypothetical protein
MVCFRNDRAEPRPRLDDLLPRWIEQRVAIWRESPEIFCWARGADTLKVAHEMGLIGVSSFRGNPGPLDVGAASQAVERPNKPLDLPVRLCGHANISIE